MYKRILILIFLVGCKDAYKSPQPVHDTIIIIKQDTVFIHDTLWWDNYVKQNTE